MYGRYGGTYGAFEDGPATYTVTLTDGAVLGDALDAMTVVPIGEDMVVAESIVEMLVDVIREFATAQASVSARADLSNILADDVAARDTLIRVLRDLIAENVTSADTVSAVYASLGVLMDACVASGAVSTSMAAQNAMIEAIFAADRLHRSFPESIADAAQLTESMQGAMTAAVMLVDQIVAGDALVDTLTITQIVAESLEVTDPLTHLIEGLNRIDDRIQCAVTIVIDGQVYTGVVINPKTGAASEYTNWPFNSGFPDLDGKHYGVAKDGIYLLEGSDDDGDPIDSYVRSGLLSIAGGIRARAPEAYLNVTSTGDLIVKATVVRDDGGKETFWYEVAKRESAAPRNTRVKIGKGLVADRWQFETHSVDGSSFRQEDFKVHPLALSRRIGK